MPIFTIFQLHIRIEFCIYSRYLIDFKHIKRIVINNVNRTLHRFPPFSIKLILFFLESCVTLFEFLIYQSSSYYYWHNYYLFLFFSLLYPTLLLVFCHFILIQSVDIIYSLFFFSMSSLHSELIYGLPLEFDSLIWNSSSHISWTLCHTKLQILHIMYVKRHLISLCTKCLQIFGRKSVWFVQMP